MADQYRVAELIWVFRPGATRSEQVRALAGRLVHAAGPVGVDGEAEVVLGDGTQLRAARAEIVAEERRIRGRCHAARVSARGVGVFPVVGAVETSATGAAVCRLGGGRSRPSDVSFGVV